MRGVRLAIVVLVALSCVAVLVVWLTHRHARARDATDRAKAADSGPVVLVATATNGAAERDVVLPADVRALYQTTLYAKVSGYVKDVRVDKGQRVKKDQILGTLESPETDQALVTAKADFALRKEQAARARRLAPDVVSQSDLEAAIAAFDSARANLERAQAAVGYEIIRAPFDGVITARYVDPGALLPAATGATQAALPFVDVADPATLRIDTFVGQDVASYVKVGDAVGVWEDARPNDLIQATVTRTSGALDPRTRTMLVEIEVDNRKRGMLPGTYAHVRAHVGASPSPLVPAEAIFVRGGETCVALVDEGRVRVTRVRTGVTDGKVVQIVEGVRAGDVVAIDLPTSVGDGGPIRATPRPARSASFEPHP